MQRDGPAAVGSQILMEASPPWGNRVFGASGPKHELQRINVMSGAVDPTAGIVIKPRHIHAALRRSEAAFTNDCRWPAV